MRWIFGQEEKLGENEMKKKVCGVRMKENELGDDINEVRCVYERERSAK